MEPSRALVFVDEANVLGAARIFGKRVDWSQLRDFLADFGKGRKLIEMVIYVGLPPATPQFAEQRERKSRFLYWLRTNGFLVVSKDGSPTEDGRYKANVDVLMALDALEFAVQASPDVVLLVTGDSDFAHLVYKLRRRGIRVDVATVSQTLSNDLRAAANDFIDLQPLFATFQPMTIAQGTPVDSEDTLDSQ